MSTTPSEINGNVVGDVVHGWNVELEERSAAFAKYARFLSSWDHQIQINRADLTKLQIMLSKVGSAQARLERYLDILEVHQNEIYCALDGIEFDVEQLKRVPLEADIPEATSQEEVLYEMSEQASRQICIINLALCDIVESTNQLQAWTDTQHLNCPKYIPTKLHNQLRSLQDVEQQTRNVCHRLGVLK